MDTIIYHMYMYKYIYICLENAYHWESRMIDDREPHHEYVHWNITSRISGWVPSTTFFCCPATRCSYSPSCPMSLQQHRGSMQHATESGDVTCDMDELLIFKKPTVYSTKTKVGYIRCHFKFQIVSALIYHKKNKWCMGWKHHGKHSKKTLVEIA